LGEDGNGKLCGSRRRMERQCADGGRMEVVRRRIKSGWTYPSWRRSP
jgi:hypothetical protein